MSVAILSQAFAIFAQVVADMLFLPGARRPAPEAGDAVFLPRRKRRRAPPAEPTVVATDSGDHSYGMALLCSDPQLGGDPRWSADVAPFDTLCVMGVALVTWHLCDPHATDPRVLALRERSKRLRAKSTAVGFLDYRIDDAGRVEPPFILNSGVFDHVRTEALLIKGLLVDNDVRLADGELFRDLESETAYKGQLHVFRMPPDLAMLALNSGTTVSSNLLSRGRQRIYNAVDDFPRLEHVRSWVRSQDRRDVSEDGDEVSGMASSSDLDDAPRTATVGNPNIPKTRPEDCARFGRFARVLSNAREDLNEGLASALEALYPSVEAAPLPASTVTRPQGLQLERTVSRIDAIAMQLEREGWELWFARPMVKWG